MSKDNVRSWDTTASNNTDIAGIGIQGSNAVSNFDGALRTVMKQIADVDEGVAPVNDTWSFCDPSDTTKKFRFDGVGITTATTRVYTAPDASGTFALLSLSQSWTQPQDFQGGANVIDSTFTIKDNGDQTRVAAFSAGGITAGNTRTLTVPDASGTISLVSSGTFTPTITGTTLAGSGTYTTQEGSYVKLGTGTGDLVHIKIKLVWTAHTGTGNMRIAGLPFNGGTPLNDVFSIFAENLTFSNTLKCTFGTASTLALQTISTGAAAGSVAMDTAGTLLISGSYISV